MRLRGRIAKVIIKTTRTRIGQFTISSIEARRSASFSIFRMAAKR